MKISQTEDQGSQVRGAAFAAFCILWGLTELIHLASFWDQSAGLPAAALAIASMILVFRPSNVSLIAVSILDVLYVFVESPYTANHILFNGFVNLTIALIVGRSLVRSRSRADNIGTIVPFLRSALIVLYLFAVFHKLNWDFFDPAVSCASYLFAGIGRRLMWEPESLIIRTSSIWITMTVELGIPALLIFKRTRVAGILIGLVFHFILALHPHPGIYSFSAAMYALLFMFLPADLVGRVYAVASRAPWWKYREWLKAVGVGAILFGVVTEHGMYVWIAWSTLCIGVFVWVIATVRPKPAAGVVRLRPAWSFALLGLIPILLNSSAPYLGLQTVRVLSMFSNLRTEGGQTNHLIVPVSSQFADYQLVLVEVISSSDPRLQQFADEGLLLPFLEFSSRVDQMRPVVVTFRRRGGELELDSRNRDEFDEQIDPPGFFAGKMLSFRPVDKAGPAQCRW